MSATKGSSTQTFLRGIESDLRALCADARRRNPAVKAAAENVILQLKEADNDAALSEAADAAASAFCTACEVPNDSAGSAAVQSQKKVTSRAVACLHKLVTHQAVSTVLLPTILDSIEVLGIASFDDSITLKVLQTNISLLSVRHYTQSLSEEQLARAFSLFFKLTTVQGSLTPVSNASTALSAISNIAAPKEAGVIELTARAAFRQVVADLFASAAESTQRRSATHPITGATPLDSNSIEIRASYRLFQDLCALLSGNNLLWLSGEDEEDEEDVADFKGLEEILILEVIDDALSGNVLLFRNHPLFADLISDGLAPAIQRKVASEQEKPLLKALLSLSATLLKSFWEELGTNCKSLLHQISENAKNIIVNDGNPPGWTCLYSLEALRCIFSTAEGPNLLSRFIHAFDLAGKRTPVVANVLSAVCDVLDISQYVDFARLPSAPMVGSSKPFGSISSDSSEVLMSIALGLFISIGNGIRYASLAGDFDAVRVFTSQDLSSRLVRRGAEIIKAIPVPSVKILVHQGDLWKQALQSLLDALAAFGTAAYSANVPECFNETLISLSSVCVSSLKESSSTEGGGVENEYFSFRILRSYKALFTIQESCGERLGRDWAIILNAVAPLDEKVFGLLTPTPLPVDGGATDVFQELKEGLNQAFSSSRQLSWNAVQELISALIHNSRASIQTLSKRSVDETGVPEISGTVRVFGIAWAETVVSSVLSTAQGRDDTMPQGLWELLAGHLVSVCVDSQIDYLRATALRALTRVASAALACEPVSFIPHGKVISPFMDLLQSPYLGTRSDTLESLHHLLQTHGDRITGMQAWSTVLSILRFACGCKDRHKRQAGEKQEDENAEIASPSPSAVVPSTESMVSDGFRVVQLIADDFLSCLDEEVMPRWIFVIGSYGRQTEDVNVALTSIGLLWRTADFVAKSTSLVSSDMLWITLLSELKDIGHDERPEVRNCAVKTLTGTLTAHAGDLSAIAWEGCIASALLPLLENVMRGGEPSDGSADEVSASTRKNPDPQLIVHHSRNTPRKQWNETRVLSLSGVASVLAIAIPLLVDLQDAKGRPILLLLADGESDGLWGKMLQLARTAAASQDAEVAVAGVASLLDLLRASGSAVVGSSTFAAEYTESDTATSHNGKANPSSSWISEMLAPVDVSVNDSISQKSTPEVSPTASSEAPISLWEAVWKSISDAVCSEQQNNPSNVSDRKMKITNDKALVLLANGLAKDESHLDLKLSQRSSSYLIKVLFYLVSREDANLSQDPTHRHSSPGLSDVVVAALNAVKILRFGEDTSSWNCLLRSLLSILDSHSHTRRRPVLTFNIVTIIKDIYSSSGRVPAAVLNGNLLETVHGLGLIMNERHQRDANDASSDAVVHDGMPLWSAATIAFETAMQVLSGFQSAPSSFWESIWKVLNDFLYPFTLRFPVKRGRNSDLPEDQEYDILLARSIRDFLPFLDGATPLEVRTKLLGLLARGAEEGKHSHRPRYVRACQEYIFNLADQRWANSRKGLAKNDIASLSVSQVTQVSDQILALFIADGQRSGKCPLPAERRAEVVFLLRKLRNLQAFHGEANGEGQGGKKHMLTLYPRLAECVDVGDVAVRNFARVLIDEAAAMR